MKKETTFLDNQQTTMNNWTEEEELVVETIKNKEINMDDNDVIDIDDYEEMTEEEIED